MRSRLPLHGVRSRALRPRRSAPCLTATAAVLQALTRLSSPGHGSDLVLNELLYDPPGTDSGAEYVELFNPTSNALPLGGCALAFVNGSDPAHPAVFWTGAPEAVLQAGGFFVVGGSAVALADAVVTLTLQNGPDAVWLLRDGQPIDRIAYGATAPGGEGSPAPDAASASIGRVPDGQDSDDNAADVQILPTLSPGAPNAREVLFRAATWRADPPWRADAGVVDVRIGLIATGYGPAQSASLRWRLDDAEVATGQLSAAAGDTAFAGARIHLSVGDHLLYVEGVGAQADGVEALSIPLAVGSGLVALNEVMPRPAAGEGEWLELICRTDRLDLTGWAIADATREAHSLIDAPEVRAGELVLVAADPGALRLRPDVPAAVPCVGVAGGWPSLNNSPDASDGIADEVLLIDPLGRVVDFLAYGNQLAHEAGRSIERGLFAADAPIHWYASPGPPTPGLPNQAAAVAPPAAGLRVDPNPFSPDGDGERDVLHVLLQAAAQLGGVQAEILDLTGDRVCALGEDSQGGTLRQWLWDGTDARGRPAPSGAYVVVVRATAPEGDAVAATLRALVALGRRR